MEKIGLILSGGGARGAYQIGVWKALVEYQLTEKIEVITGASVGALNAVLYGSDELVLAERIWKEYVNPSTFLSPQLIEKGCFSRDGLKGIISRVNLCKLKNSTKKVFISIYNKTKKKTEYILLNDKSEVEIEQLLLATSALPFVYDRVKIGEQEYIDGGVIHNTPIEPIYHLGIRKIIVVYLTNEYRGLDLQDYRDCQLIKIAPSMDIGNNMKGLLDFSQEAIRARIDLGYRDAKKIIKGELGLEEVNLNFKEYKKTHANYRHYDRFKMLFKSDKDIEMFCNLNVGKMNIKFKTCGGEMWWQDLYTVDGWKIQQNSVFKNYRIIDKRNIRRAWFMGDDLMISLDYYEKYIEES